MSSEDVTTLHPPPSPRLVSIDLLRGLVMVIMALDHTRDYFSNVRFDPTDLARTDVALFFTRWITHFCAPTFVFLAGTGAYLFLQQGRTKAQLARFLLVRGVLLIVLEWTVVSWAWTFNPSSGLFSLQVIWVIGWSMVALAGLIWLPDWATAAVGIAMIAGHNLLDGIRLHQPGEPTWLYWLINILHEPRHPVLYTLIPWIGVMAVGYSFGTVLNAALRLDPSRRRKILLALGGLLTAGFVVLRAINAYGDPSQWSVREGIFTLLSFLNTTKYPPSLLFLLMTLGPLLLALAWFGNASGPVARFFTVFGRVPLFYYVLHLYLIHALAVIAGALSGFDPGAFLNAYPFFPRQYGFSLPVVYMVWAGVIGLLYLPCRWFAALKRRFTWLRYF